MGKLLLDGVVHTDYGQLDLVWGDTSGFDGHWDRFFSGQSNGLVGAADGDGIYLNLARRSGGSRVVIELSEVATADEDTWEDVVEVSVTVPQGVQPQWVSWGGESGGLLPIPAGAYRVRVSARGRDAGRDCRFDEAVVDTYLITFWPAPMQPDAVVRVGSGDARHWHAELGGRD